MSKQFLVGVATANFYNVTTGDLIATSKTMIEDSIKVSVSSKDINGGVGNQLLYRYFHTSKFDLTFKEAQFNLSLVAATLGSSISTGVSVWTEESVTLGVGGTGSVLGTPIQSPDSTAIYGWVSTDPTVVGTKVTFTGQSFTYASGTSGQVVCVRYYNTNAAAQQIMIPANIVPSVVRCVMDAQLASADSGSGIIGSVQIEVPRLQLDGSSAFTLQSSGVSETDIAGSALSYTGNISGCSMTGQYALITQIINASHWYDNVLYLVSTVDPVALSSANSPYTLDIRAVPATGSAFKPPVSDLTFTSGTTATATVGTNTGIVTKVAAGSTIITAKITAKPSITTDIDVNVT